MRVCLSFAHSQAVPVLIVLFVLLFSGCNRGSQELQIVPPASHPLTRQYIGYGVVNVSFTHLLSEPGAGGVSQGHLRRGTIVRVIERQHINTPGTAGSWVLAEGNYQTPESAFRGWLAETSVEIFDRESRAITASRAMSQ